MTLIEIVNKLLSEGNIVEYRIRSDGGILITRINEKRYKGAEGNRLARVITGATLSEARRIQLETIRPKKGQSPKSRKLYQPDDSILSRFKYIQRVWKKKVDKSKGRLTLRKLRWNIINLGTERAREKLEQAYRYALGLAYSKNVDALLGYITELENKISNNSDKKLLEELKADIIQNAESFKEDWISEIYNALYEINHGKSVRFVVEWILRIINQ